LREPTAKRSIRWKGKASSASKGHLRGQRTFLGKGKASGWLGRKRKQQQRAEEFRPRKSQNCGRGKGHVTPGAGEAGGPLIELLRRSVRAQEPVTNEVRERLDVSEGGEVTVVGKSTSPWNQQGRETRNSVSWRRGEKEKNPKLRIEIN